MNLMFVSIYPTSFKRLLRRISFRSCKYVMVMLVFITATGCNVGTPRDDQPMPYFPVHKEQQELFLTADLPGELILDDEYLRVNGNLIIWPYGYSLDFVNNKFRIYNEQGNQVAAVGDKVIVGGGQTSKDFAEKKIGMSLPPDAEGPYWLAGTIQTDTSSR